jgi:hypothetical protein
LKGGIEMRGLIILVMILHLPLKGEEIVIPQGIEMIKVGTTTGEIEVNLGERETILVEGEFEEEVKGNKLIIKGSSNDLNLDLPPEYDLKLESVSGNITLETERAEKFPNNIDIRTVSGDVELVNFPPSFLKIYTISGDISLYGGSLGEPEDWVDRSYSIETISGDLEFEGLLWCKLNINSVSGDMDLVLQGSLPESLDTLDYHLKTKSGDIEVYAKRRGKHNRLQSEDDVLTYDGIRIHRKGRWKAKVIIDLEKEEEWRWYGLRPSHSIDYNRVDGFVLGIKPEYKDDEGNRATLGVAYSFGRRAWQGWLELEKTFLGKNMVSPLLHLSLFSTTATFDRWIIGDTENALAAFFFKEDFRDYFKQEGFRGGIGLKMRGFLKFICGYEENRISSLPKVTDWALFGGKKTFPDNPYYEEIKEGTFRGIFVTLEGEYYPFSIYLHYLDSKSFDDDYGLRRIFTILRFEEEWEKQKLLMRFVGGYSPDSLPAPFRFTMGGIGTLPAFPHKAFSGSRILLFNADYIIKIKGPRFVVFTDIGRVNDDEVKQDVGLGIIPFSGLSLRIAKRLKEEAPLTFFVRLETRF